MDYANFTFNFDAYYLKTKTIVVSSVDWTYIFKYILQLFQVGTFLKVVFTKYVWDV